MVRCAEVLHAESVSERAWSQGWTGAMAPDSSGCTWGRCTGQVGQALQMSGFPVDRRARGDYIAIAVSTLLSATSCSPARRPCLLRWGVSRLCRVEVRVCREAPTGPRGGQSPRPVPRAGLTGSAGGDR